MHDTSGKNAGTRHAIALKPRENYCNLERLHNRNQPFLRVYRNFISLHLNYVVQWLCKSMLNCSPVIDYQLVKWYILLSDAVLLEDVVKQGFGGEAEVGAEDEIDAGDGAAKVFRYKIRRSGGEEGSVYVGKSG